MATGTQQTPRATATVPRCVSCSCEIFSGAGNAGSTLCATCEDTKVHGAGDNSMTTTAEDAYSTTSSDEVIAEAASLFSQVMITEDDEKTHGNRKEEKQPLDFFVSVAEHACLCKDASCTTQGCVEMKSHLLHASACGSRIKGGCLLCQRVWLLLKVHAKRCTDDKCRISYCAPIKQKLKELEQKRDGDTRPQRRNNAKNQQQLDGAQRWQIRMKLVAHASQCNIPGCSFPGCAHTKKCLLRRRARPGAHQGGCRTCQAIWASLQNPNSY